MGKNEPSASSITWWFKECEQPMKIWNWNIENCCKKPMSIGYLSGGIVHSSTCLWHFMIVWRMTSYNWLHSYRIMLAVWKITGIISLAIYILIVVVMVKLRKNRWFYLVYIQHVTRGWWCPVDEFLHLEMVMNMVSMLNFVHVSHLVFWDKFTCCSWLSRLSQHFSQSHFFCLFKPMFSWSTYRMGPPSYKLVYKPL